MCMKLETLGFYIELCALIVFVPAWFGLLLSLNVWYMEQYAVCFAQVDILMTVTLLYILCRSNKGHKQSSKTRPAVVSSERKDGQVYYPTTKGRGGSNVELLNPGPRR